MAASSDSFAGLDFLIIAGSFVEYFETFTIIYNLNSGVSHEAKDDAGHHASIEYDQLLYQKGNVKFRTVPVDAAQIIWFKIGSPRGRFCLAKVR